MIARLGEVLYARLRDWDGEANAPRPLAALKIDEGAPRVFRGDEPLAEDHGHVPLPSRAQNVDHSAILVLRDDEMVVGDDRPARPYQADKRRMNPDNPISDDTVIAIMGAVMVASFAFAAVLPWILTRQSVDSSPAPVQPPRIEQFGPVQLPAVALPTPISNDSKAVARTEPVLNEISIVQSEKRAARPVGGAEILLPSAGKGVTRTALTAAEKAAVARGLQELEHTAPSAPPRAPAPARTALTEEEKAAVERGLRELEKAGAQPKQ